MEWMLIESLPGFQINRQGEIRDISGNKPVNIRYRSDTRAAFVTVICTNGQRISRTVAVLLHETFGPGAATDAGYKEPDITRMKASRKAWARQEKNHGGKVRYSEGQIPRRKCHDCGAPTVDYRCTSCRKKWLKQHSVSISDISVRTYSVTMGGSTGRERGYW